MGEASPKLTNKKNILFLIADDLGKYLGCYGVKSIKTPNIDKLASHGTKFDMAFTSTASCSASRSVIYTGLHTHENGQYGLANGRNHFATFDHVETMPEIFNSLGYRTGIIGKVHVGPESVYPWEIKEESETRDVGWVADAAEAFFMVAKETKRLFHLTVGYVDPHRDLTRSGFGNKDIHDPRIRVPEIKPKDVEVPPLLSDLSEVRTELAEYYQSICRLDIGVGLILQALERQGLADSTMVCFVSDNGPPFMNSKTTLYDAGIRLPVIIRTPNHSNPGTVNPNMISYIDFLPTLLDWAGAPGHETPSKTNSPPRLGKSFLPILESSTVLPESGWQHHVFGSHTFHEVQNYWPTRFLRTRRYKYHRNLAWRLDFPFATDIYGSLSWEGIRNTPPPVMVGSRPLKNYIWRPAEELYDLENDPQEVKNLAGEKEYEELMKELRAKLENWQLETKDLWLYRDGVSVVINEHHREAGLRIPDRFEIDVERPGNRDVESWKAPA
ncbi:related to N-sulphoglucosamine sulphohydrolase precursor [Phialocephala subalpina]|uniref:Related to N-sulphoglucosamine sulphohydrolase n=1 Tax=Phialocephala subalpina TaxID=576137 RepID=A0A1L7X1M5_9HELO|nr:related to N-sulphoglucosamine sulphohydrolase precursor [Phialocephala subalpina]